MGSNLPTPYLEGLVHVLQNLRLLQQGNWAFIHQWPRRATPRTYPSAQSTVSLVASVSFLQHLRNLVAVRSRAGVQATLYWLYTLPSIFRSHPRIITYLSPVPSTSYEMYPVYEDKKINMRTTCSYKKYSRSHLGGLYTCTPERTRYSHE